MLGLLSSFDYMSSVPSSSNQVGEKPLDSTAASTPTVRWEVAAAGIIVVVGRRSVEECELLLLLVRHQLGKH
jgi:hypothetical protein